MCPLDDPDLRVARLKREDTAVAMDRCDSIDGARLRDLLGDWVDEEEATFDFFHVPPVFPTELFPVPNPNPALNLFRWVPTEAVGVSFHDGALTLLAVCAWASACANRSNKFWRRRRWASSLQFIYWQLINFSKESTYSNNPSALAKASSFSFSASVLLL